MNAAAPAITTSAETSVNVHLCRALCNWGKRTERSLRSLTHGPQASIQLSYCLCQVRRHLQGFGQEFPRLLLHDNVEGVAAGAE